MSKCEGCWVVVKSTPHPNFHAGRDRTRNSKVARTLKKEVHMDGMRPRRRCTCLNAVNVIDTALVPAGPPVPKRGKRSDSLGYNQYSGLGGSDNK